MKTVTVYTCSDSPGTAPILLTANVYPTCRSGGGSWQTLTILEESDIVHPESAMTADLLNVVMVLGGFLACLWGYSHGRHR